MSTIDLIGHLGYLLVFTGLVLLICKNELGWPVRVVGDAIWVGLGYALGLSSCVFWGFAFVWADISGWLSWRKRKRQSAIRPQISDKA